MPRAVRIILITLPLFAGLAVGAWFLSRPPEAAPPGPVTDDAPPPTAAMPAAKLVVLVVFDQLRGDYLSRWAAAFGPGGFERLKRDGVWFADCHLPYACSSTAPGHASIATGAPPSVHGIVENDWYDRTAAARVYAAQPLRPYDRVPPLVEPTGQPPARGSGIGFSPERLLAETVGDRLKAVTGGAGRVVSLSLKDRSAALMGGRKPDAAYCFDTRDGRFHTGAYYRDRPHPWAETYNASKAVNAWAGKPWERFRTDLDYDQLAGPDDARGEGAGFGQRRTFPHPFADPSRPGPAYYSAVETSPAGNELLFGLVKAAVVGEKLGRGATADLLCVSFSSNDLVGHQWGPDSWEVLDTTLRSDKLVADLLAFLDETVGAGRYTLVLTADHGVCPIPEQKRYPDLYPAAARTTPRELFAGLGAALDEVYGPAPGGPTRWLDATDADAERFVPWVYLNHTAITARGLDRAAVADFAAQWVGNREPLLTAFTRRQIETGTAPPAGLGSRNQIDAALQRVTLAYHPDRCGDLVAVPKPGVLLTGYLEGTAHGSPHPYDTHVPLLAYGAGVPAGGKVGRRVSSLAVAPVVARALGIDPPATAAEKVPEELAKGK